MHSFTDDIKSQFPFNTTPHHRLRASQNHAIIGVQSGHITIVDLSRRASILNTRSFNAGPFINLAIQNSTICISNRDFILRLWNAETCTLLQELHGHTALINVVHFPGPSTVVTGSKDTSIRVWDVESGSRRFELEGHVPHPSCFTISGDVFVSGGMDRVVKVWDLKTGQLVRKMEWSGGERKTVIPWSFQLKLQRAFITTSRFHTKGISGGMINHNGNLITASKDGFICIWNWKDGSLLHVLKDGYKKHPIPSEEQRINISPSYACERRDPTRPPKGINTVISAGESLISQGFDNIVRRWSPNMGEDVDATSSRVDCNGAWIHDMRVDGDVVALLSLPEQGKLNLEMRSLEEVS
ncbi:WD40 repeat-like protein [Tothia fuscella]|uniref:WD40 repeat-like protein n=1 Tax=Tothia fuscella TaxID=1048955 RepID=A0A9P4P045_9PEZI|nr:WD40 repeat-like protein [Tothia fuscella]